ncbi:peptide/nickel transport system ATP-binding protein [Endobacter medicaginis]|uniref:Peptide/nickel transport system ATP-binding protein n=3 Tax=Endobacter medicaginis TaxID=1181271 RepID=A0A839V301_9PROT|nr:ABC transporter ATP-binding protein [Endobacter medicaginis]MBB3174874.1 peptide/nickel transport system ATP-binding protein [Endobacter medicaginis]
MLLELDGFGATLGSLTLLRGIDLSLSPGDSLALVGESGSGKTTLALALMRLLPEGAQLHGHARLDGTDLTRLHEADMRRLRGRRISMVFQEPLRALDPLMRAGRQIAEAGGDPAALLAHVGLSPQTARAWPHQLSGGQRQRVLIATAIAARPALLIADEASTALDPATQAQVLALLDRLRAEHAMGLLLVSHDLGLVAATAARLAVLYAGRLVETGPTAELLARPAHPYTASLAACSLHLRTPPPDTILPTLPGLPPGPADTLPGCRFASRCPRAEPDCLEAEPPLATLDATRAVACLHPL